MKKTRWGAAALTFAGAAGAALLPAGAASADVLPPPSFVCPDGSDTINVPSTLSGANEPALAGTVCVFAGTTAFRLVHTNGGWRTEVKSAFGSSTTNVRFYEPVLNGKVEVVTQNGQVVIKS